MDSAPVSSQPEESLADYRSRRKALVAREHAISWSQRDGASASEVKANLIVREIRENERADPDLFGNVPGEVVPDTEKTRDMGGKFLVNRRSIARSNIFATARRMPKGAHLHLHFNAQLPVEGLLARARGLEETMFIRSTRSLALEDDFLSAEIVFSVLPKDTACGNIFARDYNPSIEGSPAAAWMRWSDFRQSFPKSCKIEDGEVAKVLEGDAENWAYEKMVVTIDRAYGPEQTTNGAWSCFNQGTRAFKGLVNYESAFRWYIGAMVESMIEDGIMYAEVRPMLYDKWIPTDDGNGKLDHAAQMGIVREELAKKREELEVRNERERFPFGFRVIYCAPRSLSPEKMRTELRDCLNLKKSFPELICGFDLVGCEDRGNSLSSYADELEGFTAMCSAEGVEIPFLFHAGETLLDAGGTSDADNSNLYDALLLKSKRIGHGYALPKHPRLLQEYKERNICLEVCPTSNELLGLCGNAKEHVLPHLLAAGLPCTLNADNPAPFRSSLSHEFYQVMVGDTRMDLHGWKQLAEWSLEYSCLTEEERGYAREIFNKRWDEFCGWVVAEYGTFLLGANGTNDVNVVAERSEESHVAPQEGTEGCRLESWNQDQEVTLT